MTIDRVAGDRRPNALRPAEESLELLSRLVRTLATANRELKAEIDRLRAASEAAQELAASQAIAAASATREATAAQEGLAKLRALKTFRYSRGPRRAYARIRRWRAR